MASFRAKVQELFSLRILELERERAAQARDAAQLALDGCREPHQYRRRRVELASWKAMVDDTDAEITRYLHRLKKLPFIPVFGLGDVEAVFRLRIDHGFTGGVQVRNNEYADTLCDEATRLGIPVDDVRVGAGRA